MSKEQEMKFSYPIPALELLIIPPAGPRRCSAGLRYRAAAATHQEAIRVFAVGRGRHTRGMLGEINSPI